ncbi:MAG TPA: hypothetical protein VI488_06365 [Candidatus Angelobacter sp.]
MKGIMRKRLVALLSAAGLAGSAASSVAQDVKSPQPGNNTKTESTIKNQKTTQENKASKDAAAIKLRKAGGEQEASKDVVNEKVGADSQKHVGAVKDDKWRKANLDASSKDAAKTERKAGGEQKAAHDTAYFKSIRNDTAHKSSKANLDASSKDAAKTGAKTAATGGGGGAGKVRDQDIYMKHQKGAAESNATTKATYVKGGKTAAATNAAQKEANQKANQKVDQTQPK